MQSTAWACSAALISMIYALGVMEAKIVGMKTPLEYPEISIFEANMFHENAIFSIQESMLNF